MKENKFKILLLFSLFFIYNCSNDGWSDDRKTLFIKEWNCLEKTKKYNKNKCLCLQNQFIDRVSWDEYQKMKKESITDESNPEIKNKLDNYMNSILEECDINF